MDAEREDPLGRPYGRRAFGALVAGGISSLWWGQSAWNTASGLIAPVTKRLPAAVRDAIPAPTGGWRIYAVNPPFPKFDPATWRLRIEGEVARPLELTYADLRAMPQAQQHSDFHCVTGWSVPNVHWRGVRFHDLLALAQPSPSAQALIFVSLEQPYVDSLTMEQALLPDAMLAYDMDGRPLSRPHGAPARVVMPQMYGYKGVKWMSRIVVSRQPIAGFWEVNGYDVDAWVGRSNGI